MGKKFLDLENAVNYKDIKNNPKDYLLATSLNSRLVMSNQKGLYIWSKTGPFNDEMEIDFKSPKLDQPLNLEMITEGMHGSGHANKTS